MKCVFDFAITDMRSIIMQNIVVISTEWGGLSPPPLPIVTPECLGVAELLDARADIVTINENFDNDDIDDLIRSICFR